MKWLEICMKLILIYQTSWGGGKCRKNTFPYSAFGLMWILGLWASVFTSRSHIYLWKYFYSLFSKWIFLLWKESSYMFNWDVWRCLNCSGCDSYWRPLVTSMERQLLAALWTPHSLSTLPLTNLGRRTFSDGRNSARSDGLDSSPARGYRSTEQTLSL